MRFTEESIQRAAVRAEKTLWSTPAGFNKEGVRLDWIATVKAAIAELVPVEESKPEVNGDLLRAACDAYEGSGRIAAVIHVVLDEALKEPTAEEIKEVNTLKGDAYVGLCDHSAGIALFARRKTRLLRPFSVEERVTIRPDDETCDCFDVLQDGIPVKMTFIGREHAEIYRLGLIAKMKQEEGRDA